MSKHEPNYWDDADSHTNHIWKLLIQLEEASIPEICNILSNLCSSNCQDPDMLYLMSTDILTRQLVSFKLIQNKDYTQEFIDEIINHINSNSQFRNLLEFISKQRDHAGIITPVPIISFIKSVYLRTNIAPPQWDRQLAREAIKICNKVSRDSLLNLYPITRILTTTGINRIDIAFFNILKKDIKENNTYLEVGASVGIQAVEIKKHLKSKYLITTDILSKAQIKEIKSYINFKTNSKIEIDHKKYLEVESQIDLQLFNHDIQIEPLELRIQRNREQYIFGLHNILVHFREKNKLIYNTINNIIRTNDILWISGGFSVNRPILYNLAFKKTNSGLEVIGLQANISKKIITNKKQLQEEIIRIK